MKNYKRSDLACEAADDLTSIDGTEFSSFTKDNCRVESIKILTDDAALKLGKKVGTYITVSTAEMWSLDENDLEAVSDIISEELSYMICSAIGIKKISNDVSIMVVGLGNSMITADAIGPGTVDLIEVTRHIKLLDPSLFNRLGSCEISAIAPGVLGKTGIESAETVKAACRQVKPDAVIAIDALAAGSVERLARTVQFSDTGINPGAGIGNLRAELSRETLDIPVIAIGVPTVMDSSAVVFDSLCRAGMSENLPPELIEHLDRSERFYVTPKESDLMTEKISRLLSLSIIKALGINQSISAYS